MDIENRLRAISYPKLFFKSCLHGVLMEVNQHLLPWPVELSQKPQSMPRLFTLATAGVGSDADHSTVMAFGISMPVLFYAYLLIHVALSSAERRG